MAEIDFDLTPESDEMTMAELLEKYPQADEFEMVIPFFDDAITDEQAQIIYGDIADVKRNDSRQLYERIPEEQRDKLPDFDTLYALITEECIRFRKENAKKIEENDGFASFCDEFNRGNTKFTSPGHLWHIYNNVDFMQTCIFKSQRLKGKPSHPLGCEIENNAVLKDALIFIKVTYTWHCTTSSAPAKLFRFRLTDGAKAWLLTHADDYDIARDGFEDLALYKGRKLLFSSCTHEHIHSD
ncbi:MAG: hypothetical protein K2O62_03425 [Clostridia bacterium]|nr:hypothetical protein [Clostridia bacterium]